MSINYGKKFEASFLKDWTNCFPNTFIIRLPDQQSGYFGTSRNICDFIAFNKKLYLLECKSITGNTFPISNLTQYDKLITYKDLVDIKIGIVIWFRDHDKILYIPLSTFEKLIKDDKKSFNIKYLKENEYKSIEIPTIKKRTYLTADYTVLLNEEE